MVKEFPDPIVLIFRGTHQVMSAEKHLKKGGVTMRLIPVPRRLTSDCGLAIKIPSIMREKARQVLVDAKLFPKSAHILRDNGMYSTVPL